MGRQGYITRDPEHPLTLVGEFLEAVEKSKLPAPITWRETLGVVEELWNSFPEWMTPRPEGTQGMRPTWLTGRGLVALVEAALAEVGYDFGGPICPLVVDPETQTVKERDDAEGVRAEWLPPRAFAVVQLLIDTFPQQFEDGAELNVAWVALGKRMKKKERFGLKKVKARDARDAVREAWSMSENVRKWTVRPGEAGRPLKGQAQFGLRDWREGPNLTAEGAAEPQQQA